MQVIISGTPSEGFCIIGPFPHASLAVDWAEAWEDDIDWWVTDLVSPASRETQTIPQE